MNVGDKQGKRGQLPPDLSGGGRHTNFQTRKETGFPPPSSGGGLQPEISYEERRKKMKVTIDLCAGPTSFRKPTKHDIQKNIDALERAIKGKPLACDMVLLMDTKSILQGIQNQLPNPSTTPG